MDGIPQVNRTNVIFTKIGLNSHSTLYVLDVIYCRKYQFYPVIVWCWGSWTPAAGMWVELASLLVGILQEAGG